MRKLWQAVGILLFWASWPLLVLYINRSERTRVLIVCGGEFLALKSWLGSGKWSLPGGGLHRGEPITGGALRELHEEAGITIAPAQLKPLLSEPYEHQGFKYPCHYFVVELSSKPKVKIQAGEITTYIWLPLQSLPAKYVGYDVLTAVKTWSLQRGLIQ